jgi:hypothetical protein
MPKIDIDLTPLPKSIALPRVTYRKRRVELFVRERRRRSAHRQVVDPVGVPVQHRQSPTEASVHDAALEHLIAPELALQTGRRVLDVHLTSLRPACDASTIGANGEVVTTVRIEVTCEKRLFCLNFPYVCLSQACLGKRILSRGKGLFRSFAPTAIAEPR